MVGDDRNSDFGFTFSYGQSGEWKEALKYDADKDDSDRDRARCENELRHILF